MVVVLQGLDLCRELMALWKSLVTTCVTCRVLFSHHQWNSFPSSTGRGAPHSYIVTFRGHHHELLIGSRRLRKPYFHDYRSGHGSPVRDFSFVCWSDLFLDGDNHHCGSYTTYVRKKSISSPEEGEVVDGGGVPTTEIVLPGTLASPSPEP